MSMDIFRKKIMAAGQFFREILPLNVKKTEDIIPPVELPATRIFPVAELWKMRIREGYSSIHKTNL